MTIQEQIQVLDSVTREICRSRETAHAFLKSAGLLDLLEQSKNHQEPPVSSRKKRRK